LRLGITFYLTIVGLAEAEDPNSINLFREAQDMQPVCKVPERDIPQFAVLLPVIDVHKAGSKIELSRCLE
jgi:hypothetical protein